MKSEKWTIPNELKIIIQSNDDQVDISVLCAFHQQLETREEINERLRGGITAEELCSAADDFLTARQQLFYKTNSYNPAGEVKHLNVGLASGLDLDSISNLFKIPVEKVIEISTEGSWVGHENVLRLIDENLRDLPELTYPDLVELYGELMPVEDKLNWIKRWSKRRNLFKNESLVSEKPRKKSYKAEEVRQRVISLWEKEVSRAETENRKPAKRNVWRILAEESDRLEGSGDSAVIYIANIEVSKYRFYQWIHRHVKGA